MEFVYKVGDYIETKEGVFYKVIEVSKRQEDGKIIFTYVIEKVEK